MLFNKIKSLFEPKSAERTNDGVLSKEIINAYNKSRSIRNKEYICHAPFNNLYFNSEGHVANCWLTFYQAEIYDQTRTIKEIWLGEKFEKLRTQIKNLDLETSCKTCQKYLVNRNFTNALAKAYDNDFPLSEYPSLMELELSNSCNLECTMCNGLLSSSIRRNREGLPPLLSPYGDKFVEELREFIPHLREMRFNGGEPFLISIYYKIWDAVLELNPTLRMVVATNGTVLNERVKDYLSRGNFHINLSMDGFKKETYEKVRVNGVHERLMKNFEYFRNYCKENDRVLCVMINPMRENWQEMPDFLNFCNENNVQLWFNTIMRPEDQAIWNLSAEELGVIYQTLSDAEIKPRVETSKWIYNYNINTYNNLVQHQIKDWLKEAEQRNLVNVVSSEELFYNKLSVYLNNSNEEDTERNLSFIEDKLDALRLTLGEDWDHIKIFDLMLHADVGVVYPTLMNTSTQELAKITRNELKKNTV